MLLGRNITYLVTGEWVEEFSRFRKSASANEIEHSRIHKELLLVVALIVIIVLSLTFISLFGRISIVD